MIPQKKPTDLNLGNVHLSIVKALVRFEEDFKVMIRNIQYRNIKNKFPDISRRCKSNKKR